MPLKEKEQRPSHKHKQPCRRPHVRRQKCIDNQYTHRHQSTKIFVYSFSIFSCDNQYAHTPSHR